MGRDKKDDGLFEEPKKPCPHKNVRTNEHQDICNDCGQVLRDNPH